MKAKVSRGGGFRGALNYVFDVGQDATHTKNAERIGGNMAGADPRELAAEFAAVRRLRPDIAKPVWHCSLSLPPGDRLHSQKWHEVAADFMQRMGFDQTNTPWVAVRHCDTDKDHIHIIASRIGLDSSVWLGQWEARKSIEVTQQLEQVHGLTLTPGLGDARAERKRLSAQEINMAIRTNEEPPRQKLQRLVDEALKDKPTAVQLAERLQAAGVQVRANIAGTGRMNGFSFELAGVSFKGSDLGKAYTWQGMQKAGVSYEQVRDRAQLARFAAAAANRGEREGVAAGREPDARGLKEPAQRSGDRSGPDARAVVQDQARRGTGPAVDRPGDRSAAPELGRPDARDGRSSSAVFREEGREAGRDHLQPDAQRVDAGVESRQHGGDHARDRAIAEPLSARTEEPDRSRQQLDRRSEPSAPDLVEAGARSSAGRESGRAPSTGWASRFKQASAERRRAAAGSLGRGGVEQGNASRARSNESDRRAARTIDPTVYLESQGYTVKRDGQRHLSIRLHGDEIYRVTRMQDGRYLWCDRFGNDGGDNIDLVREVEPGTGFADAVYKLSGAPTVIQQTRPTVLDKSKPPVLPEETPIARDQGRAYLQDRGISLETIEAAEKAGMVRYAAGAVLFVGRDQAGAAQNVTRRATVPGDRVQKRDLRGSDKSYPPVLPGDPAKVWIVEGGADALALRDMARRQSKTPPTVIVSGGANVRSFLERAEVQAILRRAERVTIAGENEKDADTQARTDAAHAEQARRVAEITGRDAQTWTPKPDHGKDLADLNARQAEEIERQHRLEMQRGMWHVIGG